MRVILLIPFLLVVCASTKPYAEVALDYPFTFSTDYWVHQDRSWQCEPPGVVAEAGLETKNGWKAALYHESTLLCGSWNKRPEIYENGVRVSKEWGGW